MSSLLEFYIKKEKLATMLKVLDMKNQDGVSIQVSISDDTNQYGQNVSASVSQSKEDREAKKDKFYVGNGKVFWTDGVIKKAVKVEKEIQQDDDLIFNKHDLPF